MVVEVNVFKGPSGSIFIEVTEAGIRQECPSLHLAAVALEQVAHQIQALDEPMALTGDRQLIARIENRIWRLKTGLE